MGAITVWFLFIHFCIIDAFYLQFFQIHKLFLSLFFLFMFLSPMGADSTSKTSPVTAEGNEKCETQVVLNVYDLTPANSYSYWFGVGVFHSGIEVHGKEYGFGAHDFAASGVFEVEPRTCPGFIYRSSVTLGKFTMSPSEFRKFIETIASEYHGDTYHLIYKNCNHFTDDVSSKLIGKRIPGWVNRLARMGAMWSCLLPESLKETTVKVPEFHEVADLNPTKSAVHSITIWGLFPPEEECTSESLALDTRRVMAEIVDDEERRLLTLSSTGTSQGKEQAVLSLLLLTNLIPCTQ